MFKRTIAAALSVFASASLLASDEARAGAAPARAHARPPAAGLTAAPVVGRGVVARHSRDLVKPRRDRAYYAYPSGWPGDCLAYGACGDLPLGVAPYAVPPDSFTFAVPAPAASISQPSCRWQTQTRVVAAEAGGEREIRISRCLPAEQGSQ
jgi:hypothetical protein